MFPPRTGYLVSHILEWYDIDSSTVDLCLDSKWPKGPQGLNTCCIWIRHLQRTYSARETGVMQELKKKQSD